MMVKNMLGIIAMRDVASQAAVLRRLLRSESERRGLWPARRAQVAIVPVKACRPPWRVGDGSGKGDGDDLGLCAPSYSLRVDRQIYEGLVMHARTSILS